MTGELDDRDDPTNDVDRHQLPRSDDIVPGQLGHADLGVALEQDRQSETLDGTERKVRCGETARFRDENEIRTPAFDESPFGIEEQDFVELRFPDFRTCEVVGRDLDVLRVAPLLRPRMDHPGDICDPAAGFGAYRARDRQQPWEAPVGARPFDAEDSVAGTKGRSRGLDEKRFDLELPGLG